MGERLYTDHPQLYDAIQSEWDYDRDVAFVSTLIEDRPFGTGRLLEIGCGTGEHTRRFVEEGFEVTAVDKYGGMLDLAWEKCEASFVRGALPELPVDGEFDLVVALRGVINHVPPDRFRASLAALANRLTDGGLVVFDNAPLPADGNHPALDVGTTSDGEYARIAQHVANDDGTLEWREAIFTPDGGLLVSTRTMTPYEDHTIAAALTQLGLQVETHEGFGPGDDRTVFVGRA